MGQVAIGGTALLTSLSSTVFLQAVTHPYVTSMHEIIDESACENDPIAVRKFRATRLDIFGRFVSTDFVLSDAQRITGSAHPFASVQIKGQFFYIFGKNIDDVQIRHGL